MKLNQKKFPFFLDLFCKDLTPPILFLIGSFYDIINRLLTFGNKRGKSFFNVL